MQIMPNSGNRFVGQFLLLDIGHPMTVDCIKLVKKSLTNVLSLASYVNGVSRVPVFGCATMDTKLNMIQQWKFLSGNFSLFESSLDLLDQSTCIGNKITMRDYKLLLESSVERIINDFDGLANEWKTKTKPKNKLDIHQYWPSQIQITIITKKSAYPIVEIIKESTHSSKLKKIEMVEIRYQTRMSGIMKRNMGFISCFVVSESYKGMDDIFKNWIVDDDTDQERLRIILDKESGLHLKCDLNDCLINPMNLSLKQNFFLSGSFPILISPKPIPLPDNENIIYELEAISRIELSMVCPSELFGFPQRIYAARTCNLTWDESQFNSQLFMALCSQLFRNELGLITKVKEPSRPNQIPALYFIISDGTKLLMQNIIPVELLLPQRPEPIRPATDDDEEAANSVMDSLLGKLQIVQTISPCLISNGIYENLKHHLKSDLKKSCKRTNRIPQNSASKIKLTTQEIGLTPGEYTPAFLRFQNVNMNNKQRCSRKSPSDEGTTHPALLSPQTKAKYKQTKCIASILPELMEPGMI